MDNTALDIAVKADGGKTTIVLNGRLNTATASELQDRINSIIPGATALDLDFAGIEHIASAGLRVLAATEERLREVDGTMRILNVNSIVREIFDMTGFSDILTIV